MRDGLHKDLSLGREWQGLAKACEREAERGDTAREKASDAIAADVRKEVPDAFVDRLVTAAENAATLLPSFTAFGPQLTPRHLHNANTPLQAEICANAARLEADGVSGRLLARRAIEEAIKDRGQRRGRQIGQHYAGEGAIARAANNAINRVDTGAIAEALLEHKPLRQKHKRREIDLDEDLTKPR